MATKTEHYSVKNGTISADGASDVVKVRGATKVSMHGKATLAGTTPSLNARVQCKDANGNWKNLGSGVTKTATATDIDEAGITGPFPGSEFRINFDVDVADGNEAYTSCQFSLSFERDDGR